MKHLELTSELQDTAAIYAAGAMPESERRQYARHLEEDGCDLCRKEVLELQAAMHAFALDLPGHAPSPAVKMRLMAQAELSASMRGLQNRPAPRRFERYEWMAWLVSAASTAALIVVLFLNSNLRDTVNDIESPHVRVVNLAGQGATPKAAARVFWNESQHRWLVYVSDLPPVAKDRAYQAWFVPRNGAPVSAVVFNTSADGTATLQVPVPGDIGELKAVAVTTEPAGGLPQPTGSFVLLGAL